MLIDIIPECCQVMRASPWNLFRATGTARGFGGTAHQLMEESSQAEWFIKCPRGGCNRWNIPSLDHDLLKMIGRYRHDISPKEPGLVCAGCGKPLSPRVGRWVHRIPDRKLTFPGYHVSQTIIPDTAERPDMWRDVVELQAGGRGCSTKTFLNEVCGETYDEASRLVTVNDLRAAMVLPWQNTLDQALAAAKGYRGKVLAIDWGGGGGDASIPGQSGRKSWTVFVVLALTHDGRVDVLYSHRSVATTNPEQEARLAAGLFARFGCDLLVHDFSYAGNQQETFLGQAGLAQTLMQGFRYAAPGNRQMMGYVRPAGEDQRPYYALVKAQSLGFLCDALKAGYVRLPKADLEAAGRPCVYKDILNLTEERIESKLANDYYLIGRVAKQSDDWAQALNIGAHALWWRNGKRWPNLARANKFELTALQAQVAAGDPAAGIDWDALT